jgi:hypothetical protein
MAIWWIPADQNASLEEAVEKMAYLQKNDPSELAFDFRNLLEMKD